MAELIELCREECLHLLEAHAFGRLAVSFGHGAPVIRPVNYVYDPRSQSLVFRTDAGSKLHALLFAANASFEIDEVDGESRIGWSVIVHGKAEEVTDPRTIDHLETLGLEVWAPGERTHWMHIRTQTVSGRRIVLEPRPAA